MSKKLFLCLIFFLLPLLLLAQDAEDIIVPQGYKVKKIAETNRAIMPRGMTFDTSDNLVVASWDSRIYKVDQKGKVEVIVQTRRFGFAPSDVEIMPDGSFIAFCFFSGEGPKICRIYPPDNVEPLIEEGEDSILGIDLDKAGNFYVFYLTPLGDSKITRYDNNVNEVESIILPSFHLLDIAFDMGNNMYVVGLSYQDGWEIREIPAGGNGIPGPEDPFQLIIPGIYSEKLTIDDAGNIFTIQYSHWEIDGFSQYYKYNILKIHQGTWTIETIVSDVDNAAALAYKNNYLYVSELSNGVISKIDLNTMTKTNLTTDYGVAVLGDLAFDQYNNIYTTDFYKLKLFQLTRQGSFEPVGQGIGYAQTIANDGTYFYIGSLDAATSNGRQILKIDPMTGTHDVIGTHYNGWRGVTFDSYGRLILLTDYSSQYYNGLDIIDLDTGQATPYVTGMKSKKPIYFDSEQNLYYKEGWGDGIKKVQLEKDYSTPRDLSDVPFFYDFTDQEYPPSILFFHVTPTQQVYIPQMEVGKILKGDQSGNTEILAQGFLSPTAVDFDNYGAMLVTDSGNGIFKITYDEWTIPAVIEKIDDLIPEIEDSSIHQGTKKSLIGKLDNAIKSLEKSNINSALGKLRAFINKVNAQKGKKIPVDMAERLILLVSSMIEALEDVYDRDR